ncbi:Rap1a/Tai family immunity protein [Uliginosibacterium sp. TH139]|uniref:Rap1a/Tai family immunity protein n=1 Tax=Uliginosibacterium sp. TH139 TaxID=2067453 RepID=UPI000C7CFD31|nr:Rap1a/Tai family immunity protein [Uliginosibacterium sp. TH139]PLK47311.1 hypothetical protein C0V76_17970 [Uliginosibacterium sp. TH139]
MRSADVRHVLPVGAASAARQRRASGTPGVWSGRLKPALCAALCAASLAASAAPDAAPNPGIDSVNLSGADFFAAYTHSDPAIRERAQLYLLGVMDASEGRSWCSYRIAKSVTLREIVFEHLRKQPAAKLSRRASSLIEEGLQAALPCKEKK